MIAAAIPLQPILDKIVNAVYSQIQVGIKSKMEIIIVPIYILLLMTYIVPFVLIISYARYAIFLVDL